MALSRFVTLATFLAGAIGTSHGQALTLGPIASPHNRSGAVPSRSVRLQYGANGAGHVNVSLAMQEPTVLLESIAAVTSVDCNTTSVAVVFNSSSALASAAADWAQAGRFVLVTNHLGDCDAELERGFFLASSVAAAQDDSLTLVVSAARTSVNETAGTAEISFSAIPATTTTTDSSSSSSSSSSSTRKERDLSWDPSGTVSDALSLASTTLYSYAPYVTVTADSANLSVTATLSGRLKYSIWTATLEELTVDFNTAISADVALTVNVGAPYNTTASYAAPSLSYSLVDVPGIITLGPELAFSIGVSLAADAAVVAHAALGLAIADGNVHVDFRDSSYTTTSGWTPTYKASANISEEATVTVDPYVDVSVELACEVLGGLLDLSVGLDAQPRLNNEFVLSASQTAGASSTTTTAGASQSSATTTCAQGVHVTSEFVFNLIATITQFWSDTIYSVTVPIADKCYEF